MVPLVPEEPEPVPAAEPPEGSAAPAEGMVAKVIGSPVAGTVAASAWVVTADGWVVTGLPCVVTGRGCPVTTPRELVWGRYVVKGLPCERSQWGLFHNRHAAKDDEGEGNSAQDLERRVLFTGKDQEGQTSRYSERLTRTGTLPVCAYAATAKAAGARMIVERILSWSM